MWGLMLAALSCGDHWFYHRMRYMLCKSRVWLITRVYFPIAGIEYLTITWRENLCYEHVATLGV